MKKSIVSRYLRKLFPFSLLSTLFILGFTMCNAQYRPGLFFREDWKEIPAAIPVTQEHVANKNLTMTLYGPGLDSLKKSNHEAPVDDPFYVWSGLCRGNWAVTLKDADSYVDLTSYSKIRWRAKQSGLRALHIVLKLADGTWLVSAEADGVSKDWRIVEFNISDINWYTLNIESVVEVKPVKEVNLSRVDEIGFTDLMTGGLSDACSRLDWIEVWGKPVAR
jgi:hypothetical protein